MPPTDPLASSNVMMCLSRVLPDAEMRTGRDRARPLRIETEYADAIYRASSSFGACRRVHAETKDHRFSMALAQLPESLSP